MRRDIFERLALGGMRYIYKGIEKQAMRSFVFTQAIVFLGPAEPVSVGLSLLTLPSLPLLRAPLITTDWN
jgi:hypothetical protein